jgi:hypothetical protein
MPKSAGCLAACALFAGCMIPTYHLPGGFSGTYHRHLYGMESAPCADPLPPDVTTESRRAIFYPVNAFQDSRPGQTRQSAIAAPPRDPEGLEPMRLAPEAPKQTVLRNPSAVFN